MNSKIKLILCDLDDTLLNSNKEVTGRTRKALLECAGRGIKIGYITVRSPRKVGKFIKALPCDCISNYNGAIIRVGDQVIDNYAIDHKVGMNLIGSLLEEYPGEENPGFFVSAYFEPLCLNHNVVRLAKTQEATGYSLSDVPPYNFQRIRIVPGEHVQLDLSKYASEYLTFTGTIHGSVIVSSREANKENAVHRIREHFGLENSEILSFGDDLIDIGMLNASGIGVAMGNAVQEVKDIADYVTLSNEEDGIAEYLYNYIL
ncbi:MAG TPA: HAD family hydrolase [Mobilitalea sp.]|nr:HAD family hydrolase [Mobilitalea sp.]